MFFFIFVEKITTMLKLIKLLMLLFIANSFQYSAQESKVIELEYRTRTVNYTNGSSGSSSQYVWKTKGSDKWQSLGRRYSLIEPTLNTYKESADFLNLAKSYRKKYNATMVGTIVLTMATIPASMILVGRASYNNPDGFIANSFIAKSALVLGPPLIIFISGSVLWNNFKNKGYVNFHKAVDFYNNQVNGDTGMIKSLNFGLSFNTVPNTTKYTPQFALKIGLK